MPTRVPLIAHATTRDLRSATFGGDAPLDDVGRRKAEALAGSLGKVDTVFVSPTLRAREPPGAWAPPPRGVVAPLGVGDAGSGGGKSLNGVGGGEPFKLFSWIKTPA